MVAMYENKDQSVLYLNIHRKGIMHRLLIILLVSISLYGMEEFLIMKEEALLDGESQEQLLIEEAIRKSLEGTTNWQMLPSEVKCHIFSFIPEEMKNLILVDWECHNLTREPAFLQSVAIFVLNENLEKAVNIYAYALESDNEILHQALLTANLHEKVIRESGLEMFSKESSLEINSDSLSMNKLDSTTGFIKAIIRSYPQVARIIFIKAAGQGDLPLINICFDNGIALDINNDHNARGRNALMEAAYNGHIEIVKLLIVKDANVNSKTISGETALMFASISGHLIIVEFLLNQGADVNAKDIWDETALLCSTAMGHIEVVECLLNSGADIQAKNMAGLTALMITVYGRLKVIKLHMNMKNWIEIDEHLNANYYMLTDYPGITSLIILKGKNTEYVRIIHNVYIKAKNHNNTSLQIASSPYYYNIAKKLIEWKADINTKNTFGQTPLILAAELGKLKMVKLLLDKHANPHIKSNFGETALMFACLSGHVDVVKELLPISNVNEKNSDGFTALELILIRFDSETIPEDHQKIIELFMQYETLEGKQKAMNRCSIS